MLDVLGMVQASLLGGSDWYWVSSVIVPLQRSCWCDTNQAVGATLIICVCVHQFVVGVIEDEWLVWVHRCRGRCPLMRIHVSGSDIVVWTGARDHQQRSHEVSMACKLCTGTDQYCCDWFGQKPGSLHRQARSSVVRLEKEGLERSMAG